MAKMYLMSGLSGSGKTTYAKAFAEENNLLYLNPDDFYGIFHGDDCIHEDPFEIWITLFRAIHLAEVNGRDCIVDTNSLTYVERSQFLDWFPSFEHHLIYVYAPYPLCVKNNGNRRRKIPDWKMKLMYEKLEPVMYEKEDKRWVTITRVYNENNKFSPEYLYRRNEE